MKFTVGMAFYDRPEDGTETPRTIFTIMSLQLHHPLVGEIIVVDNNPQGESTIKKFVEKIPIARYIPMPTPQGTAAPRNRIFEEAKLDHVVCIDSHILLYPECLESLQNFYSIYGQECPDLLHGPMMTEAGEVMADHLNDQWREEMLGTWARAWQAPGGSGRRLFSVQQTEDNLCQFVSLDDYGDEQRLITAEDIRNRFGGPSDGPHPWSQHEKMLYESGCTHPSRCFTIPGHGMGFFTCRKDAWLPFHKDALGFGGEEITTGKRFRKAFRKCWCVPGAKWWHNFNRHEGPSPYRLTRWDKARNYVLEFKSLGLDLAPIREEFHELKVPEEEWQQILAGARWPHDTGAHGYAPRPEGVPEDSPALETAQRLSKPIPQPSGRIYSGLDGLYELLLQNPTWARTLPLLYGLVGGLDVVELGTGKGAVTTALLAGRPRRLWTYDQKVTGGRAATLNHLVPPGSEYKQRFSTVENLNIPECDILVIRADGNLTDYLTRFGPRVRAAIAVFGTENAVVFGNVALYASSSRLKLTSPAENLVILAK